VCDCRMILARTSVIVVALCATIGATRDARAQPDVNDMKIPSFRAAVPRVSRTAPEVLPASRFVPAASRAEVKATPPAVAAPPSLPDDLLREGLLVLAIAQRALKLAQESLRDLKGIAGLPQAALDEATMRVRKAEKLVALRQRDLELVDRALSISAVPGTPKVKVSQKAVDQLKLDAWALAPIHRGGAARRVAELLKEFALGMAANAGSATGVTDAPAKKNGER
jgi:hypothetical protein